MITAPHFAREKSISRSFSAILAASGTRLQLARMEGEVLAHLELHPVDLGKEPRRRQVVVRGIGLRPCDFDDAPHRA